MLLQLSGGPYGRREGFNEARGRTNGSRPKKSLSQDQRLAYKSCENGAVLSVIQTAVYNNFITT